MIADPNAMKNSTKSLRDSTLGNVVLPIPKNGFDRL